MRLRVLFISSAVLLGLTLTVNAQSSDRRDGLRGITTLRVVVESLPTSAEGTGLDLQQLQTDVELRLRKARVTVLDKGVWSYVYLNVNIVKASFGDVYAVSVELAFQRGGLFGVGKDAVFAFASVWSKGALGIVGKQNLSTTVRDTVGDLSDQFINDLLAANPKS
jgi:hypothetical protein